MRARETQSKYDNGGGRMVVPLSLNLNSMVVLNTTPSKDLSLIVCGKYYVRLTGKYRYNAYTILDLIVDTTKRFPFWLIFTR